MKSKSNKILDIMRLAPVIPVLTVNDPDEAVALAKALVRGGLPAIEITLRTENALACIKAVAERVEGAVTGAGTVLSAEDLRKSVAAKARFLVSPGTTQELIDAAEKTDVPLLPGVATASEAMSLGEMGYQALKFFPAEQAGGAPYLKALSQPLPNFHFCPTGGINLDNIRDYLALPNVLCVGGSWVAPSALVVAQDWDAITELARQASGLAG
jgi:2-dehydro-3-deoxyphosphogluconate aldolase/(4S)-4-hydroxy-2-oxoglutarate aldolase